MSVREHGIHQKAVRRPAEPGSNGFVDLTALRVHASESRRRSYGRLSLRNSAFIGIAAVGAVLGMSAWSKSQPNQSQTLAAACLENPNVNLQVYEVNGNDPDVAANGGVTMHTSPNIQSETLSEKLTEKDDAFIGVRYNPGRFSTGANEIWIALRRSNGQVVFVTDDRSALYSKPDEVRSSPNGQAVCLGTIS